MHSGPLADGHTMLDRNIHEEFLAVVPGAPRAALVVGSLEDTVGEDDPTQTLGIADGFERDMLRADQDADVVSHRCRALDLVTEQCREPQVPLDNFLHPGTVRRGPIAREPGMATHPRRHLRAIVGRSIEGDCDGSGGINGPSSANRKSTVLHVASTCPEPGGEHYAGPSA